MAAIKWDNKTMKEHKEDKAEVERLFDEIVEPFNKRIENGESVSIYEVNNAFREAVGLPTAESYWDFYLMYNHLKESD